jgi:hypothetical protein
MTMSFQDAIHLVDSGQAEEALERFIIRTMTRYLPSALGHGDGLTALDEEFADQVIVAHCLERLLKSGHARAAINLSPRTKGKTYSAAELFMDKGVAAMALRYHQGHLDKNAAMNHLSIVMQTRYGDEPSPNTMARILRDLEHLAAALWGHLQHR